ncbi:hypothetical protein COCNU_scaffold000481G000030 [Cocos nucifera]|nr:hypothetical protein [Cocos nucifera]
MIDLNLRITLWIKGDKFVDLISDLDCNRIASTTLRSSTISKLVHYLSIDIESANNNKAKAFKASKEAEVVKVEASQSRGKVEHLKEALKEVERTLAKVKSAMKVDLASEVEKRRKAEAEVSKIKKEEGKRVAEAKQLGMKEFKASKELTNIKVLFAKEAYNASYDTCQRRVTEYHPELDLNFLEDERKDSSDLSPTTVNPPSIVDPPAVDPSTASPLTVSFYCWSFYRYCKTKSFRCPPCRGSIMVCGDSITSRHSSQSPSKDFEKRSASD